MKNSRRQVMAQIARLSKTLQCQEHKIIEHQNYFGQSMFNRTYWVLVLVLPCAFAIGWKVADKKWTARLLNQVVEIGTIACLNYFKKTLSSLG